MRKKRPSKVISCLFLRKNYIMSHAERRKENNCLNCGATVIGRYCHVCGQENIVPHETFWHMVQHFFYDITHFDSKFLDTVKYLVRKPGFLSKEYNAGRRTTYLHPVKMYVFTSAVFFLIFFSIVSFKGSEFNDKDGIPSNDEFLNMENIAYSKAKTKADSNAIKKAFEAAKSDSLRMMDSTQKKGIQFSFGNNKRQYKSLEEYDSIQKTLPSSKRDRFLTRTFLRKGIDLNTRYGGGKENQLFKELGNKFIHSFPYLLFVSLPLFTLFLKMLYFRHKQYYFVDHGIMLLHLYIFTFLLMMVFFGIDKLEKALGWSWLGFLQAAVIIYGIWYAYKCLRNFYGQGRGKTIVKFILFNILCFITLLILFAIFFVFIILRA